MVTFEQADLDNNGVVDKGEWDALALDEKRREILDADLRRDTHRALAKGAAIAALTYPLWLVACDLAQLNQALKLIGDIAGTFYISAMGVIMAFYGKEAMEVKGAKNVR